jgi:hypothetical protein
MGMFENLRDLENLSAEQLRLLRHNATTELGRIGEAEFARRLNASTADVRRFLEGARPAHPLLAGLVFYDFGPYPDLAELVDTRFYEGYDYDTGSYGSWEPAVDRFVRDESHGKVVGAALDIRNLLATTADDKQVRKILQRLGCRFSLNAVELTERQWLQAIHDRLVSADVIDR